MRPFVATFDSDRFASLRRDLDDQGVLEVAAVLFREAPNRIRELSDSLAKGDRPTFERAAHSLKSNARLFGANDLADHCAKLEEDSRAKIPPDARARLTEIGRLYRDAEVAIRAAVAKIKA